MIIISNRRYKVDESIINKLIDDWDNKYPQDCYWYEYTFKNRVIESLQYDIFIM